MRKRKFSGIEKKMVKKKVKLQKSEEQMEQKSEVIEEKDEQKPVEENVSVEEKMEEQSVENETKEKKFVRLAEKRMSRLLHCINSIGKLSNRNNYVFTDKQVEQILIALNNAFSQLESKFHIASNKKPVFVFST